MPSDKRSNDFALLLPQLIAASNKLDRDPPTLPVSRLTQQRANDAVPVRLRSHSGTPQLEQFRYLANLFDPNQVDSDNPEAKLGAMKALLNDPGTIRSFRTPMSVAGITYYGNPSNPSPAEIKMLNEAGLTRDNAKGHILIDLLTMAGMRRDTIKHELAHSGGASETQARFNSIVSGENVQENLDFLKEMYPKSEVNAKFLNDLRELYKSSEESRNIRGAIADTANQIKATKGQKR